MAAVIWPLLVWSGAATGCQVGPANWGVEYRVKAAPLVTGQFRTILLLERLAERVGAGTTKAPPSNSMSKPKTALVTAF